MAGVRGSKPGQDIGLVLAQAGSGAPDPAQFPQVAGSVFAVAPGGKPKSTVKPVTIKRH